MSIFIAIAMYFLLMKQEVSFSGIKKMQKVQKTMYQLNTSEEVMLRVGGQNCPDNDQCYQVAPTNYINQTSSYQAMIWR